LICLPTQGHGFPPGTQKVKKKRRNKMPTAQLTPKAFDDALTSINKNYTNVLAKDKEVQGKIQSFETKTKAFNAQLGKVQRIVF